VVASQHTAVLEQHVDGTSGRRIDKDGKQRKEGASQRASPVIAGSRSGHEPASIALCPKEGASLHCRFTALHVNQVAPTGSTQISHNRAKQSFQMLGLFRRGDWAAD
jgi:hypothetical protein